MKQLDSFLIPFKSMKNQTYSPTTYTIVHSQSRLLLDHTGP